jgi:hypothetical protein
MNIEQIQIEKEKVDRESKVEEERSGEKYPEGLA